jgi:hypothetical protein
VSRFDCPAIQATLVERPFRMTTKDDNLVAVVTVTALVLV